MPYPLSNDFLEFDKQVLIDIIDSTNITKKTLILSKSRPNILNSRRKALFEINMSLPLSEIVTQITKLKKRL